MAIMTSLFDGPLTPERAYGSPFFTPRPYTGYGSAYGGQYGIPLPGTNATNPFNVFGRQTTDTGVPYMPSGAMKPGGVQPGSGAPSDYITGIPRPTFENNPGGSVTGFPYGSTPNPTLDDAIAGLFAKGLIPDIARQSAELVAGRGIAGSPASYSTAVRMSEADYLQRLALANTLLSGEAGRNLPYQITPYQRSQLELQRQQLELQRKALEQQQFNQALNNYYRYQGGYGGGRNAYGGGGGGYGGGRIGAPVSPYSSGGGTGFGNLGPGPFGSWSPASSLLSGGVTYGGGGNAFDLDAALQELGIGDNNGVTTEYGTDFGQYPEPPDFNYDMWD